VRLCIADPPYLGRAERHYGIGAGDRRGMFGSGPARAGKGRVPSRYATTEHPDAAEWDDPAAHAELVRRLDRDYDGWAVAMWPTSLPTYLAAAPDAARVCVWAKDRPVPGGSRIITAWEPVLVRVPDRRRGRGTGPSVRDTYRSLPGSRNHVGSKPDGWTHWVLDLLGYDPETDTVDDLFPGSGAVTDAIATRQLTIEAES
jgi:hypothetical protein